MDKIRKKVICVVSKVSESEYKDKLDNIEEIDPDKTGGSVEFVFAVNKLSEGWDVANVFQIVPVEERVFNSKLLISQVLGRGLRIPQNVPNKLILQNYPVLTVTNHDKFADHIKELIDSVTQSDMYLSSTVLSDKEQGRGLHHFTIFNLNYVPVTRNEKIDDNNDDKTYRQLILSRFEENLGVTVIRTKDEKRYQLSRNFHTIDQIVYDIYNRFKLRTFESLHFDFGNITIDNRYPEEDDIKQVILDAMSKADISGNKLSEENRKQIDLYFNQFLSKSTKRRIFENIEGDIIPIRTLSMEKTSTRLSELERDATAFLSEDYENEAGDQNKFVLEYLEQWRGGKKDDKQMLLFQPEIFIHNHSDIIRTFVNGDTRSPYVVNKSKLKNPQNIVLVSHTPEKEFVFLLIKHSDYVDSWIKSPDKSFYSIDYEYWKGGKDRTRRSFNPDFFIKIDMDAYISKLEEESEINHIDELKDLQDDGIEHIIKVVEIKSDDDQDETTPAKEEYAKSHFEKVNTKLKNVNIADIDKPYRSDIKQYYTFDLLTPVKYQRWILDLKKGKLLHLNKTDERVKP